MRAFATTLIVIAATSLFAAAPEEGTAIVSALKTFRAALKAGEVDRAVALSARFPRVSADQLRQSTEELVDRFRSGTLSLWIFPSSVVVSGDCAVVVVGDGEAPAPDDPAYLLRQNNQWKVFPGLSAWDEDAFDLTVPQREAFTKLREAYKEAKKQLRKGDGSSSKPE